MYAKGHVAVGLTTGATIGVLATAHGNLVDCLLAGSIASVGSLLTSQLPDIDSPNSKISQKIPVKKVTDNNMLLSILLVLSIVSGFIISKVYASAERKTLLLIGLPIILLSLQIILRIALKHRFLTHTLLFNGILSAGFLYPYYHSGQQYEFVLYIGLGLTSGLIAHLFYDTITVRGCPLLYPFYKKNISPVKFLNLKSGEYDKGGVIFSIIVLTFVVIYRFFII